MKATILLVLYTFSFALDCAYNNVNKYQLNNEDWILLGHFGEKPDNPCKYTTSIKISSIESFNIMKTNSKHMIIFTLKSRNSYVLENYDFESFNEILKANKD